jgi:hypothetical protein
MAVTEGIRHPAAEIDKTGIRLASSGAEARTLSNLAARLKPRPFPFYLLLEITKLTALT